MYGLDCNIGDCNVIIDCDYDDDRDDDEDGDEDDDKEEEVGNNSRDCSAIWDDSPSVIWFHLVAQDTPIPNKNTNTKKTTLQYKYKKRHSNTKKYIFHFSSTLWHTAIY